MERWRLPCEGALGRPDLGVALWAGRNIEWAVTPDARNTRTAIAVYRGLIRAVDLRDFLQEFHRCLSGHQGVRCNADNLYLVSMPFDR
jgi:hypothetical protein